MKNSIRKDTIWLSISKVTTLVLSTACIMLLSRIRTLHEYGTYSQIIMATTLISTLFIMGLPNSINYFLAKSKDKSDRRAFITLYYTINCVVSIIVGVLLVVGKSLICKYFNNSEIANYWYFLLLYPFVLLTTESLSNVLVFYSKTTTLTFYNLIHIVVTLTCIVATFYLKFTFSSYMAIFLICEIFFAVITHIIVFRTVGGFSRMPNAKFLKTLFAFSVPIGLAYSVGTLTSGLDKLMISHWYSTEQYAIYSNAAKELPLSIIATASITVIMPRATKMIGDNNGKQAVFLWKTSFAFNYILMCLMVFGIICFAPDIMTILYSSKYLPGLDVFRIYVLIMLIRSTSFGMLLIASGKTRLVMFNSVFVLIANVGLNFLFYFFFGFIGPAIASVCASVLEMSVLVLFTSKHFRVRVRDMIPFKTIIVSTFVNLFFFRLFSMLKETFAFERFLFEIGESLLLGGLWTVFYGLIMWRLIKQQWRLLGANNENY